ncbi:MAG: NAD-dependent epimerase/dehydratase family protein [Candidatus Eiseniibacteriota bacterium]
MRVVVTGNLGYVGTVLTPLLAAAGHEVWGLDSGFYEDCLLGPSGPSGVARQHRTDLRAVTAAELDDAEAIVHLGALSNDPTGELNPGLTHDINTRASVRLAELAKGSGVRRFVFASSCSIYGASAGGQLDEDSAMNPLTAYARSKVDTEAALLALADERFAPTFLRNGTAYGFSPRLRVDIVVNNLVAWAVTTGKVTLQSDGRAWRPLVHVEDMGRAILAALSVPVERVHRQALNIGREEDNWQIRAIAEAVARVVPGSAVTFAEGASADSRNYNVSFAKVRRVLPEFVPRWSVEAGIRELYEAFRGFALDFERFEGREFTRLKQLLHLMRAGRLDADLLWIPTREEVSG